MLRKCTPSSILTVLQRIRGAIDARIAEEQARQKASQDGLSRSNSTSAIRRGNNNSSSISRPRPRREGSNVSANVAPVRGPDPAEFDAEFVVGDEGSSGAVSRSASGRGTPVVEGEGEKEKERTGEEGREAGHAREKSAASLAPMSPTGWELPTEVRVKLRRLDKLEGRYQGRLFLQSWVFTVY